MNLPLLSPIYFKSRFAEGAPPITRAECVEMLVILRRLSPELRRTVLRSLPEAAVRAIAEEWWWQVHGGQEEPDAAANGLPWRIWAIVAARGFGKTRAGAEWVWARAREHRDARIALVGASIDEVERVMIRGESGLIALARCDEEPHWIASQRDRVVRETARRAADQAALASARRRGRNLAHAKTQRCRAGPRRPAKMRRGSQPLLGPSGPESLSSLRLCVFASLRETKAALARHRR